MMKFKKSYAFLFAGVLALSVGAGLLHTMPETSPVKAATTTTDTIVVGDTNATGSSYVEFSGVVKESGAVYAGENAKNTQAGNSIQLRSNGSSSGIVSTTSGGYIREVSATWASNTSTSRTLDVYGSNVAFTKATELYNVADTVTKLGSIKYSATPNSLQITGDYQYVGVRSNSGALYLSSLGFTWESATSDPTVSIVGTTEGPVESSLTLEASASNFTGSTLTYSWTVAEEDTELVSLENETTSTVKVNLLKSGVATINVTVADENENSVSKSVDVTIHDVISVAQAKQLSSGTAYVKGIVYAMYGSPYIADADGTGMQLYAGYNATLDCEVGDEIIVKGTIDVYNSAVQLASPVILETLSTGKTVTPKTVTYDELNDDLLSDYITIENMVWHSEKPTAGSSSNINFYSNGDSSKKFVLYSHKDNSADYIASLNAAMTDWQEDVTTVTLTGVYAKYNQTLEINLTSATTYEVDKVETFARSFLANLTCDPDGVTAPSTEEWNALAAEFALLSEEEKAVFTTGEDASQVVNEAIAKYDYVMNKYGDSTYTNFMNRTLTENVNGIVPTVDQTNNIIIIVSVCVLALSAIAVFVIIYRRKRLSK